MRKPGSDGALLKRPASQVSSNDGLVLSGAVVAELEANLRRVTQSLMSAEDLNVITNPDVFRTTAFDLCVTIRLHGPTLCTWILPHQALQFFVTSEIPKGMRDLGYVKGISPDVVEHARKRCQCWCGCRRRPGRLRYCDWCGMGVGKECCVSWEDHKAVYCHFCRPLRC